MELDYEAFKELNYVIALQNPSNTPLIDPFSFAIGKVRNMTRSELKHAFNAWKQGIEDGSYQSLFPRQEHNLTSQGKKLKADIQSLSLDDIIINLEAFTKRRHGNLNLLREGSDKVFNATGLDSGKAYSGQIWLQSQVRRRGSSRIRSGDRNRNRDKFIEISISGPFESSRISLDDIVSEDREYRNVIRKFGYDKGQYLHPEAAALLMYAKDNPDKIRNYAEMKRSRDAKFWVPFDITDEMAIDVLVNFMPGWQNKSTINRSLLDDEGVYSPKLISLLENQKASYVPIASRWILDRKKGSDQQRWFNAMDRHLQSKGYRLSGLAVEKKASPYESIGVDYTRGRNSVRLMFFDNLPPLAVLRTYEPKHKPQVFHETGEIKDFYEELFKPKTTFDDKTRRYTRSEVLLPSRQAMTYDGLRPASNAMIRDYHEAIDYIFPGGMKGFRKQLGLRKHALGDSAVVNFGLAYLIADQKVR